MRKSSLKITPIGCLDWQPLPNKVLDESHGLKVFHGHCQILVKWRPHFHQNMSISSVKQLFTESCVQVLFILEGVPSVKREDPCISNYKALVVLA